MKKTQILVLQQNLFEVESSSTEQKLPSKKEDDYVFDLIDALQAPILTFSQLWADSIPKRFLDLVTVARLKALMKKEELATEVESVIYIYTRTLESPMDSEWTDIYTHVSCKTLSDWFGEDHWMDIPAPKVLSEWLQSKLNDLRRHIYTKRRGILKARMKEEEKIEKITEMTSTTEKQDKKNTSSQSSLFS